MIEILGVTKCFEKFKALDDVSISIPKGSIHGIIGPNGAGKSTLLQCIVGIYSIDCGQITIDQETVWDNFKVKEQIGYVADRNQYFRDYTVSKLIGFFEKIYKSFKREDFDRYNRVFEIPLNKKIIQLSKGMQMRLSFMLNLAIHPKVLVLDEPTSGLDAVAKNQLLEMLIEEVDAYETTVIIASHHLGELEKICDGITLLEGAKVARQTTVEDLKEETKKLQIIFEAEPPNGFEQWKEWMSIQKIGCVYYVSTNCYDEILKLKLKESGVRSIEEIGMSLEEIFVCTYSKKGGITDEKEC